ncbi:50S ribosomal protein L29 [Candidatus Woesearchaeota archaeon]|nr:50S ribosomal protein L29 [Candidatus Woesearchaeota archaeon]
MKIKEIRAKKPEELKERLGELRRELIKLNTQIATGTTLKSPGQVKKIKKTIARILTVLNKNE